MTAVAARCKGKTANYSGESAMTEAEWLACDNLYPMLIFLRGDIEPATQDPDTRGRIISSFGDLVSGPAARVSSRKLACFALECCRKWWELPLDETSQELIRSYEMFLQQQTSWADFLAICGQIWGVQQSSTTNSTETVSVSVIHEWSPTPFGVSSLTQQLAWVTASYVHRHRIEELTRTATEEDLFGWGFFGYEFPGFNQTAKQVFAPLPALLREIVGNPFRSVAVDSSWRTSTVIALADGIYTERAFDRLPILADALQEADCHNEDLLSHLRGPGPHARGCWALDLALGQIVGEAKKDLQKALPECRTR